MNTHRLRIYPIILGMLVLAGGLQGCTLLDTIFGGSSRMCTRPEMAVTKYEDTDDGVCAIDDCSLREAVITANECEGTQTIRLGVGVYELSIAGIREESSHAGDLDITDDLIIIGDLAIRPERRVVVDANGIDRVFEVHRGAAATFEGVKIINGELRTDSGGGIYAHEDTELTLINSQIENNTANSYGGGVYSVGDIRVEESDFRGNVVNVSEDRGWPGGGGIYLDHGGSLIVWRSNFEENQSTGSLGAGGALVLRGPSEISESSFTANEAETDGGAINAWHDVLITLSTLTDNIAGGSGGGLVHTNSTTTMTIAESGFFNNKSNLGGGMRTWTPTTITDTTFDGNEARAGGGLYVSGRRSGESGDIVFADVPVHIENSRFVGNFVNTAHGSALHNHTGTVDMVNVLVDGNHTGRGGAAVYSEVRLSVSDSTVRENTADISGFALYNDEGEMNIENTSIEGNYAVASGDPISGYVGVGNLGDLTLTDVDILNNGTGATSPGMALRNGRVGGVPSNATLTRVQVSGHFDQAIHNVFDDASMTIRDSTISGNSGGAIRNSGVMELRRSTISGNSVGSAEPGGRFCGVLINMFQFSMWNSTISENTGAGDCATIVNLSSFNAGDLKIESSTIYNNSLVGIVSDDLAETGLSPSAELLRSIFARHSINCSLPTTSVGWNLYDDSSCGPEPVFGDLVELGALGIGPLADNGGATQTHNLELGSPAIDAGSASCLATDQRGYARPVGSACDIGAFEKDAEPVSSAAETETTEGAIAATPTAPLLATLPIEINFNADTYSLVAGECTRLRWDVKNAEVVTLESQPVLPLEAEQVCPPSTKTYKMVASNSSEEVERFVTIEVSTPVVPPKAPAQLNVVNQVCTGQTYAVTLGWIDAADNEDGYRVYRDGTLIATLGPNAKSFTDSPPYGGPYTYGVEAFNSAGSSSRPSVQEAGCII
jgi:CSLREA domain-containing protein